MPVSMESGGIQSHMQDALNNYGSAATSEKSDESQAFSDLSHLNLGNAGGDLAKAGAEEGGKFKAIGEGAAAVPAGMMSDAKSELSRLAQLPQTIMGNMESGLGEIASGVRKLANPL